MARKDAYPAQLHVLLRKKGYDAVVSNQGVNGDTLAGALRRFRFLRAGLSVLLILVGLKMLLARFYKFPTVASFAAVVVVLTATILLSLLFKQNGQGAAPHEG